VKEADITIDGITVLAGENGCGKSTLSRWLYYLVNGAQQFDTLTIKEYVDDVSRIMQRHFMAAREMRQYIPKMALTQSDEFFSKFYPYARYSTDVSVQQIQDDFEKFIHSMGILIKDYIANTKLDKKRERIFRYLNLGSYEDENVYENSMLLIDNYIDGNLKWLSQRTEKLYADLDRRPFVQFVENICHEYDENDGIPNNLQLQEDEVDLIGEDRVSSLFNLRRAIYIDTPMALTNESAENVFWNELRTLVVTRPKRKLEMLEKKLLRRVSNILHGEAKMVKDDSPFADDELHFISDDGKVNIEIEKVATGFKTFIYLQRLLENGFLGNDSILLIDEPEAHLHPQWIVEYARILVLLNKELGLKIMLATHNPDMVAAIRSIAEKEEVLDKTNFYISESSGQSNTYCYKALGTDISEIFSSFNIALDRIQAYGSDNL
jgi:predicted ATPase